MLKPIIISSCLVASLSVTVVFEEKGMAQNPPAETFQPGFWQPVARVDLNQPIIVNLINETDLILDYDLTNAIAESVSISPNSTATIENIKPSLYILIYPQATNINSSEISLKYNVEVTPNNTIKLKIQKTTDINNSHRSFNLHETGAIYLY